MRSKKSSIAGLCGEVCIQPENDIGCGVFTLHFEAVENGNAIGERDETHFAAAFCLKGLFHSGAGAPIGGEAFIGIDSENRCGVRRDDRREKQGEK